MRTQLLVVAALAVGLTACNQQAAKTTAVSPNDAPVLRASIQDIMKSEIDAASAVVWKTPDSFDPAKKATPAQIDADWQTLRKGAVTLIEAPNLLVMEGRVAAHPGSKLQDEGLEGNLDQAAIQKALQEKRPEFLKYARGLQDASVKALAAIDKRDQDALLEAGGGIDEACEACHKAFWYPEAPTPP